jgi:hypothetical protein
MDGLDRSGGDFWVMGGKKASHFAHSTSHL